MDLRRDTPVELMLLPPISAETLQSSNEGRCSAAAAPRSHVAVSQFY